MPGFPVKFASGTVPVSDGMGNFLPRALPPAGVTGSIANANRVTSVAGAGSIKESQIADGVTGNVLTLAGTLTALSTWSFPDRSDTVAGLAANTFSALQTFGAGLTVTAGTITLPSLSLPDNALSTNVCILNANQTFTSGKIFRNSLGVRFEQAGTQDAVFIQGGAFGSTSLTATITTEAALTGSFTYRLPTLAANDTFAMRGLPNTFTAVQNINVASGTIQTWQIAAVTKATLDGSGNLGIGVVPTAANGLLQLASGTTKANGLAYGDTNQFRYASGGIDTTGPAATDIVVRTTRSSGEACLIAAISGSALFGAQSNHQLTFMTNNAGRFTISADGLTATWFDGISFSLGTTTGTKLGTSTTQKLGFWNATPIAQRTGYGTPIGNVQTINFPGATATLLQTSQELAQLLLDLKAAGIIGA